MHEDRNTRENCWKSVILLGDVADKIALLNHMLILLKYLRIPLHLVIPMLKVFQWKNKKLGRRLITKLESSFACASTVSVNSGIVARALSVFNFLDSHTWIMDSGATNHVTSSYTLFPLTPHVLLEIKLG